MSSDSEKPHPEEHPTKRAERWARIRRVKQMLKFMPRRAVMHKYPLVGRFAEVARKRAYLWSMKPEAMRPAIYAGSILTLLPVMGAQLPLALILSFLLRANFMVMGGLQLITNPFTAAPIYYATHELGAMIIATAGFGEALPSADPNEAVLPLDDAPGAKSHAFNSAPNPPPPPSTVRRIGTAINALIIGGVVSGVALGLVLDILYRNYWQHHTQAPRRRRGLLASGSAPPPPTEPPAN